MKETVFLYFITGFLGSGKTTFLKEILGMLPREKVGLIVNEFGQVNVDGEIIKTDTGFEVVEINNGQIFCGCVSGDFVNAITESLKLPIRHLIVETSGMANPYNIQDILRNVSNRATEDYAYKGMICLVDPTNVLVLVETLNAAREQIARSDFVLINKADLVSPVVLKEVEALVRSLNDRAPVLITSFGRMDEEAFLSFLAGSKTVFSGSVPKIEQTMKRPLTYLLQGSSRMPYASLMSFCDAASLLSFRIKGYAWTEQGVFLVDGLDASVAYKPTLKAMDGFQVVLISAKGDIKEELNRLFADLVGLPVILSERGKEYWGETS